MYQEKDFHEDSSTLQQHVLYDYELEDTKRKKEKTVWYVSTQ